MNQHRFTLQPIKGIATKYTCPQCEAPRKFKKYIDLEGKLEFPDFVGRCDRESNCAYHYTPKQFFADYPDQKVSQTELFNRRTLIRSMSPQVDNSTQTPSLMDAYIVDRSLGQYERNNLMVYLCQVLGQAEAYKLAALYQIGTSNHWHKQGATVFWQRDEEGQVRAGKIMLYDPTTGKRRKEEIYKPTWVHRILKLSDFTLSQCFFGLHQVPTRPTDIVAIVESEKTALIATAFYPRFIWLATGGLSNLSVERCRVLTGRKVILYPDLSVEGSVFKKWSDKVQELATIPGLQVHVSSYLEDRATQEQKIRGLDIADFLLIPKPAQPEPKTQTPVSTWNRLYPLPERWDVAAQLTRMRRLVLPPGVEELTVEPCDSYPADWDAMPLPINQSIPTSRHFFEWQRQHKDFSRLGLASLPP